MPIPLPTPSPPTGSRTHIPTTGTDAMRASARGRRTMRKNHDLWRASRRKRDVSGHAAKQVATSGLRLDARQANHAATSGLRLDARQAHAGATLVEVLVAIFIMAIGL